MGREVVDFDRVTSEIGAIPGAPILVEAYRDYGGDDPDLRVHRGANELTIISQQFWTGLPGGTPRSIGRPLISYLNASPDTVAMFQIMGDPQRVGKTFAMKEEADNPVVFYAQAGELYIPKGLGILVDDGEDPFENYTDYGVRNIPLDILRRSWTFDPMAEDLHNLNLKMLETYLVAYEEALEILDDEEDEYPSPCGVYRRSTSTRWRTSRDFYPSRRCRVPKYFSFE